MTQPIVIIDAFTDTRFGGNPAAVCVMERAADPDWMQSVAAEMNLSETAFIVPRADPAGDGYDLRWFTPVAEVDLCGHATLASAHWLWESGGQDRDTPIRFHTLSGLLIARATATAIWLDFPAEIVADGDAPAGLDDALGVDIAWFGQGRDLFVMVEDDAAVLALQPVLSALAAFETRGVVVTARAGAATHRVAEGADFVSRFFAPRHGIDEDPVTGSAHCALAPFWGGRLGKIALHGYQASRRGGHVLTEVRDDRVLLGGGAVTTLRGMLT